MRWLLWIALVASLPLHAAEVKKGYPASYELARLNDAGERIERVIASGETLLLADETVTVRNNQGEDGTKAVMAFQLDIEPAKDEADEPKVVLNSRVELATVKGQARLEAPDNPDSFIEGPKVTRQTFTSESWRRVGDPTPIVTPFEEDGRHYRLTVILDPVYTANP